MATAAHIHRFRLRFAVISIDGGLPPRCFVADILRASIGCVTPLALTSVYAPAAHHVHFTSLTRYCLPVDPPFPALAGL